MKTKTLIGLFVALSLCPVLYATPNQELATEIREVIQQQLHRYTFEDLVDAIYAKDTREIKKILASGQVDVNAENWNHQTLLNMASDIGNYKIAKLLIKYGADVNFRRPLKHAIIANHKEVAELLIEKGAEIEYDYMFNAIDAESADIVELLLEKADKDMVREWLNHTDMSGKRSLLLSMAIYDHNCDTEVAKVLIEHGVNTTDALAMATANSCSKIAKILIKHGPNK